MPRPIPERLDVAQTHVLKLDTGVFPSNSFRGVLRVLLVHEEIVREEPSSLAIVSSHVAILHKEDLVPGEEGDIRNEFVNRASAFHISNPDLEWASRPGSRKLPGSECRTSADPFQLERSDHDRLVRELVRDPVVGLDLAEAHDLKLGFLLVRLEVNRAVD